MKSKDVDSCSHFAMEIKLENCTTPFIFCGEQERMHGFFMGLAAANGGSTSIRFTAGLIVHPAHNLMTTEHISTHNEMQETTVNSELNSSLDDGCK